MKKIFTSIYPFKYLHVKWWHRLFLVFSVLLSIVVGVAAFDYFSYDLKPKISRLYVTTADSSISNQVACEKEYFRWGICSTHDVFDYLITTRWGQETIITTNAGTLSDVRVTTESQKDTAINALVRKNIIEITRTTTSHLGNIVSLSLIAILSAFFAWLLLINIFYRTVIYVIFGNVTKS
jgi:predicted ATPase